VLIPPHKVVIGAARERRSEKKPPTAAPGMRNVAINTMVIVAATVYRRARMARPG